MSTFAQGLPSDQGLKHAGVQQTDEHCIVEKNKTPETASSGYLLVLRYRPAVVFETRKGPKIYIKKGNV